MDIERFDIVKARTTLMYTVIGLFMAAIAWIVVSYFLSASLTITTDDASNTILVSENKPTRHGILTQAGISVSTRVEAGDYTVTVESASTSIMRTVSVGIGEHKTITLDLHSDALPITTLSPVTTLGASSFTAASDHLTFIDHNDADTPLYTVNTTNQVTTLDNNHSYVSVKWANPSWGIGLVSKGSANYGLVKIDGSSVSPITLPFTAQKSIAYAVSPNMTWYISDDHTVYRANGDGSFTKVYTSSDNVAVVAASNDAVLFSTKPSNAPRATGLAVLHQDGTKYQIAGEQYESAWSPLGDKLIVSSDSTTDIFDAKLNAIAPLPQGNVVSPVWLNDTTLLYVLGGNVWRYDMTTGEAKIIISIDPLVGTPSSIVPDTSGTFLYISVFRANFNNPTFMLGRVSLGSQQPPDGITAQHLNIIFPDVDSACTINYMNFTALSIVYKQSYPGQNCVSTARDAAVDSKVLTASEAALLNYQQLSL